MKKIISTVLLTTLAAFAINIGEVPVAVSIANEDGGRIDGTAWNSSMLKEKVHIVFYVDPDEKDTNNALSETLKAKNYDLSKFTSVAIVNLAATWLPNFAIESKLAEKQKEYPDTVYVKDKKSVLVKQWELADDSSDILLFDKEGKLLYSFAGKLDAVEIQKVVDLIDEHI
ncbi:MAG TPA: transcriptional regulator [Campylobacterales bacterium]|nr:transcriptional regulator [Campylobacterales bacterium]